MRCRSTCGRPCGPAAPTRPVRHVIALAGTALISGCGAASAPPAVSPVAMTSPVRPALVSAAQLARLPMATTFGRSPAAPQDPDPFRPESGIVLHPTVREVVY